jgi:hypothetical protein
MTKLHALMLVLLFVYTNAFLTRPATGQDPAPIAPPIGQTVPEGPMESWMTDTVFQRMADVYGNEFQVVTKGSKVVTTNPGGFYFNVLFRAPRDLSDLMIVVLVPEDFAYWGENSVHAWVDTFDVTLPDDETAVYAGGPDPSAGAFKIGPLSGAAGSSVFVTVHVRYALASLPSATYLPRVYTFGALASSSAGGFSTSASMTGVLKK